MKNLLISLFAIVALNAMAFIGPVDRSANLSYDGTAMSGTLEKHFMNVKNGSGGTLAAGSVVVLDLTADDGFTVTTSTTQTQSPACIIEASCASAALCRCQVYGYATALLDANNTNTQATAGARFFLSANNAGYIQGIASPNGTQEPGGIFYDTTGSSGSVEVFIKSW